MNKESKKWTIKEIELLKMLYPKIKNEDLPQYFNGRTKGSIYAKAKNLSLSKEYNWRIDNIPKDNYWNNDKTKELIIVFKKIGEYKTYEYFKNKYNHGKTFIRNKLIALNLIQDYSKKYIVIDKYNPYFYEVFKIYKGILNNDIDGFQKYAYNISKQQLVLLYRYYNRINNININNTYFENNKIGDLLEKAKIKSLVKKRYHSYYDFICECYPSINLIPWKMKYLNVKDGFWNNKYNRFWCIKEGINNAILDGIIYKKTDILELDFKILPKYISGTMLYYYGKQCIIEYFDFFNINYDDLKIYNNIRFDSFQEKSIYKYIYENITKEIKKCFKKEGYYYINSKYNENYVPDFYIKHNNKNIIIEYFGLYKENPNCYMYEQYKDRAKNKIEFYNTLDNIIFIGLYPEDILSDFKGVKDKLTLIIN